VEPPAVVVDKQTYPWYNRKRKMRVRYTESFQKCLIQKVKEHQDTMVYEKGRLCQELFSWIRNEIKIYQNTPPFLRKIKGWLFPSQLRYTWDGTEVTYDTVCKWVEENTKSPCLFKVVAIQLHLEGLKENKHYQRARMLLRNKFRIVDVPVDFLRWLEK